LSEETLERVYTINLGKVWLSPNNQRAKRAINMIKEFATHHMKSENVKIEEDVSHLVWARGIRHPPRKIRVKLTKDDDGNILISKYEEEKKVEEKTKGKKGDKKTEKKEKKVDTKVEEKPKVDTKVEEKPKASKSDKKTKKD
jgi:large subunit ribosomal protein L31e